MATYDELRDLFGNGALRNKVEVACIVAAETVRTEEPPVAARLAWAKAAFRSPRAASENMLMALLAANKDAEVSAITGATDAQIQAKVDAAVDVFVDGS